MQKMKESENFNIQNFPSGNPLCAEELHSYPCSPLESHVHTYVVNQYLLQLHVHARPKVASPFLTATRAKPQEAQETIIKNLIRKFFDKKRKNNT